MKAKVVVLDDNFDDVRGAITGEMLMAAAKAGGHVIKKHAKENASSGRPGLEVETRELVDSIKISPAKSTETYAEVDVGPSVIYGAIHEFGGFGIPARPYMRPAIDENEDKIVDAVADEIRGNLEAVT